jgi:L-galactose dehydrogenase
MDKVLTAAVGVRAIGLINASPLHIGMLTAEGPPPWHPASRAVAQRIVRLCEKGGRHVTDFALGSDANPVSDSDRPENNDYANRSAAN